MATVLRWGGEPTRCKTCSKLVFAAEEVMANGYKFHKLCLKCSGCSRLLHPGNFKNHNDEVYCNNCHTKMFGPKGYGFVGASSSSNKDSASPSGQRNSVPDLPHTVMAPAQPLQTSNTVSNSASVAKPQLAHASSVFVTPPSQKCARCTKTVYAAEKIIGGGRPYHKLCFRCLNCGKSISSNTLCERNSELYCKACYGRMFGPKGFGFGIATLSPNNSPSTTNSKPSKSNDMSVHAGPLTPVRATSGNGEPSPNENAFPEKKVPTSASATVVTAVPVAGQNCENTNENVPQLRVSASFGPRIRYMDDGNAEQL